MPAHLELIVNLLDLLAFFLVTPVVIGESRVQRAYLQVGGIVRWLREVYYVNRGPFSFAGLTPLAVCLLLLGAYPAGIRLSETANLLALVGAIVLPASLVTAFLIFTFLTRRLTFTRALALVGAALFIAARGIAITNAASRL